MANRSKAHFILVFVDSCDILTYTSVDSDRDSCEYICRSVSMDDTRHEAFATSDDGITLFHHCMIGVAYIYIYIVSPVGHRRDVFCRARRTQSWFVIIFFVFLYTKKNTMIQPYLTSCASFSGRDSSSSSSSSFIGSAVMPFNPCSARYMATN